MKHPCSYHPVAYRLSSTGELDTIVTAILCNANAGLDAVPHLQLFDFLLPHEIESLLEHVDLHPESMPPSTVLAPDTFAVSRDHEVRRSRVDLDVESVWSPFEDRLMALLPHLRREFGIAHFVFGSLERQLTVHADGDFFSRHLDENFAGPTAAG